MRHIYHQIEQGKRKFTENTQIAGGINLHSNNTVVTVTSNMEPCTWVDKSWIPTLQHIIRII